MTKFTWEPSTGGSLLLRVTKGSKTTTWTIKKTTKTNELVKLFTEITKELGVLNIVDELAVWAPMRETVRTVDQEELEELQAAYANDQITEEMSRAEQARFVASLNASGGQFWNDGLEDLELRTLGKGDPE